MPPAPPLTQIIGRTERALSPLMDRVLAGTGGTFPQWVALTLTAANGDGIERPQLIARLAGALQIDDTAADAVIGELADEQLLQAGSPSVVALSDAGRERHAAIRAAAWSKLPSRKLSSSTEMSLRKTPIRAVATSAACACRRTR